MRVTLQAEALEGGDATPSVCSRKLSADSKLLLAAELLVQQTRHSAPGSLLDSTMCKATPAALALLVPAPEGQRSLLTS